MAPTGPRASRDRQAPRASRGGISKQRGANKTDRDGDVSMDAPAGGGANAPGGASRGPRGGRGNNKGTRSSSRIAQNVKLYGGEGGQGSKSHFNRVTLKVHGIRESKAASNSDGGRRALLEFLEKKASKTKKIVIGRNVVDGDYVWISVNKDDAADILRLSGFAFAGANLTITETDEKMPATENEKISKEAQETKDKLNAVLARRYNPEQRLLDLSALGADDILSTMGTFDSQTLAEKAFKVLVHLASQQYKSSDEKKEAIQAVSLARNDINDVSQVIQLAFSLPDIKRLDMSGNKLEATNKIAKWQYRFKHLSELHLAGNPVTTQPNYVTDMLQWFPSLQNLDGQQVRTPEEVAASLKALEPTPIAQWPSNLRDGENNVAATFLQAFFPSFDTDRDRLVAELYDSDSWFSLSVIPNSGRPLAWKNYLKYSRNIQKFGPRNPANTQRLFTSGSVIKQLWKAFPATNHPTDDPSRWLVDCHTFPHLADPSGAGSAMGLMINVHGQFEENDPSANLFGTRTFTRTFILGPSKPVPPPPHPYRVLSDQLTLFNWTPAPEPAPTQQVPPQQVSAPSTAPVPVTAVPIITDAMKMQLIEELSKRTGMTAEYSRLCLDGAANWNFDLALQSFEQQKANLPPTAFVAVP